jgi:hypothetical protein
LIANAESCLPCFSAATSFSVDDRVLRTRVDGIVSYAR